MVPFRCNSNPFRPTETESASLLSLARIPKSAPFELQSKQALSWEPAVDIFEDDNQFIVEVELPGINPEFVDIDISDNSLLIHSTQSQIQTPFLGGESSPTRIDRERIPFVRHVTLPALVKVDNAETRHENGVLTLRLPKSKPSTLKAIKIHFEN